MTHSAHSLLLPFLLLAGIMLNSCNGGGRQAGQADATTDTASSVRGDCTSRQAAPLRKQVKDSIQGSSLKSSSKGVVPNDKENRVDTHKANRKSARLFADLGRRTVSKFFANSDSDTLNVGRARLAVPREAMAKGKVLSITPLRRGELPTLPTGMVNVTGGCDTLMARTDTVSGYRFLPHGNHFVHHPASIAVPYDSTLIPEGYTVDDIHTYYYDELHQRWTMLRSKGIDTKREVAMAETSHFTDVINGIIKVPESPETQNYVPTGISELKAADPAAGIQQIEAPSANQNGTATLSCPFEVPAGRNDIGVSAGLQYSSEGGSSFAGYGWSLPVQSIDIETRWGVPRFDDQYESESYLLMGQQLSDRLYRRTDSLARQADKQFYPMTEGGFSRIIRKGNSPKNYYWEVTGKDGTVYSYGGHGGHVSDATSLADTKGNRIRWALDRVTDVHGNFAAFHYMKSGNNLYPERYTWTGFGETEGLYSIEFDIDSTAAERKDVTSSGRLGIMQRDKGLLRKVTVKNNGQQLRSYTLNYEDGPFGKMLLKSIDQNDSRDGKVATQSFDYYNDLKNGLFSSKAELWKAQSDDYESFLSHSVRGCDDYLSLLGGGASKSHTTGRGTMIGVGFTGGTVNVGPSFSNSKSSNTGKVAFVDIDGDGLPDKLFKRGNKLFYRKNMNADGKDLLFGKALLISGVNSFSEGNSISRSLNADAAVEVGITNKLGASVGISYTHSKDQDKTTTYLYDFNSDGLTDIAVNGQVYFNHVVDGKPAFSPASSVTANPIIGEGAPIDKHFIPDYKVIRDSLEKEYPLNDAVRMWCAPFAGRVNIQSTIKKLSNQGDGIIYSIQHEGGGFLVRDSLLQAGSKTNNLNCNVKVGDRIFFRLQSRYDGEDDRVLWNPIITYVSLPVGKDRYLSEDLKTYSSKADYIEGENNVAIFNRTGKVTLHAPYRKAKTTDDVTLIVTRLDHHGETIVKRLKLPADSIVNDSYDYTGNIDEKDSVSYFFEITTTSPLDWTKVQWAGNYFYETDQDRVRFVASRRMFNKPVSIAGSKVLKQGVTVLNRQYRPKLFIVPTLSVVREDKKNDTDTATVYLTLHDQNGLPVLRHTCRLNTSNTLKVDTIIVTDTTLIKRLSLGKITATFAIENELASVRQAKVNFLRDSLSYQSATSMVVTGEQRVLVDTLEACVFSGYNSIDYGRLYRGWGQFAYNGNKAYASQPIEVSALTIDRDKYKDIAEHYHSTHDGNQLAKSLTPVNEQRFFVMGYDTNKRMYVGGSEHVFISLDTICSSRIGEDAIIIDSVHYAKNAGELSAPVLMSESKSNGYGVSGGISYAGLSGSKSTQTSYSKVSLMDINGNGYPDWLEEVDGNIVTQYTKATGTLGEDRMKLNVTHPKFKASSSTIGADASLSKQASSKSALAISINPKPQDDETPGGSDTHNSSNGNAISSVSVSASGNFTSGTSHTESDWTDLNGDGLPDMLFGDKVKFGLGYDFTNEESSGVTSLESSENSTWGAGLGTSIEVLGNADISFGVNGTKTTTKYNVSFIDVNGDGLPDMVTRNADKFTIMLNTGSGFIPYSEEQQGRFNESLATSVSQYGNFAVSIPIHILFLKLRFTAKATKSWSSGVSFTSAALRDIDGDGHPDIIVADGAKQLIVYRNLTGRTNLLRSVTLPFGGHINIGYEQTTPSYDLPGRRWVMSSVETIGGYKENGAVRSRNTFEYSGGYRDRRERDFYGFRQVRTNQIDTENGDRLYRYSVQTYGKNRDYYTHGLVTSEYLYTADGKKLQGSLYDYDLKTLSVGNNTADAVVFPALKTLVQSNFDEVSGDSLSVAVSNTYDDYGNLQGYKETTTGYSLEADISYHKIADKYIVSIPSHITVSSGGKTYRERSTKVDGNGEITEIMLHNGDKPSVYNMTYDGYGNITRMTKPENYNHQRMFYAYTYDDRYHSLVTSVRDAYGYSSSTAYDGLWNAPSVTTDLNGQKMEYTYDALGRQMTIRAPYEIESGQPFTIRFEYFPAERKAHTVHYSKEGNIDTYTFADSLMRAVQAKQTGVVWSGGSNQKVSIVSGRAVIDAFGRNIAAYYPMTESHGSIGTYSPAVGDLQAKTEYDAHDRTTGVTLADGSVTRTAYTVGSHDGEPMLRTTVTDALGRHAESYTDAKGRNRETVQHARGEDITVKYGYDPVGQVMTVQHPNGRETKYAYDLLGRKLMVNHPDAGETDMTYDAAGNLLTKLTAELRKSISDKGCISYTYDFERLHEVLYPENLFNRVTYTYGKAGDKYNRAGRLALVEDASGGEAYYYGRQGEVVKTVRTVMASVADIRTYVYGASYDSWNRVRTMTYPDGEVVTYHYNAAGQVESLTSNKQGRQSVIVDRIGYDKEGHTVYTKLGNGTETTYTYDRQRERLQVMNLTADGQTVMENRYRYDAVDNILGITNAANPTSLTKLNRAKLGGRSSHTYEYDELNRLIHANGKAKRASYDMVMSFGRMSEPLTKVQKVDSTTTAKSYDFAYKYEDSSHPTAPTQIGHDHYTYDANGNPTLVTNDSTNMTREMYWDEDNRLMVLSDNGKTSRYTYNAAGERIMKSYGTMEGVYINGAPQGITFHETDNFTLYPASIISINKNRFTKHYFIGNKRVASRIGTGLFNNVYGRNGSYVTAGQQDYAERMNQIQKQKEAYYKQQGIAPGVPTMKGAYGDPENTKRGYNSIIDTLGNHDVPQGWIQTPRPNTTPNTNPGPPVSWNDPTSPDDPQAGYGYIPNDTNREETFFYHSDYLGSTSYITDDKGNITQYDSYLPYGELLVDEHSSSEDMPYKFNGKEMDAETGLYYYGARYMNPVTSLWYGVDPLAEKYASMGGYVYTLDNPVKLVDTDGRIVNYPKNQRTKRTKVYYKKVVVSSPHGSSTAQAIMTFATSSIIVLGADDATGIGTVDDIAIPIVGLVGFGAYVYNEFVSANSSPKESIFLAAEHTKGARKSTSDKHTAHRAGSSYGQNRNSNRGDKNKKYQKKANPNKRKNGK
ncbi:SpvB/TcaC N-terminal domain-containing protein [Prevotella multiformis]|uniref:RHS repeat-associated core domain protein n=1 Tax=Prevotella multiformis DSM 16608 TaxID=888743 RepID=F0F937_9BACT|nr:SpvB/TcaC N-terminal domain-containing protein [Prevotella multiformis]EGC19564.1 RHS repeat-associated core domain protein [Prevotella multiformis DSM 16608]